MTFPQTHGADAIVPVRTSLKVEPRATVDTATAAYHLNRAAQTLRSWACGATVGPLRPLRINGRLAWRVADLRKLCEVE